MEQARLLIAFILSFLVWVLWNNYFLEKPDIEKNVEKQEIVSVDKKDYERSKNKQEQHIEPVEKKTAKIKEETPAASEIKSRTPQIISVNNPFYSIKISDKGTAFKSFVLKDYNETIKKDSGFKEIVSEENSVGTIKTEFGGVNAGIGNSFYDTEFKGNNVDVFDRPEKLVYSCLSSTGLIVEKTYTFFPDSYLISLDVVLKNETDNTIKDDFIVSLVKHFEDEGSRIGFEGSSALIQGKLETEKITDIDELKTHNGKIQWVAIQDRYFISSIIPENIVDATMKTFPANDKLIENQYIQSVMGLVPGESQRFTYNIYIGPASVQTLKTLNCDLDKAVNFGWFDLLAKPCLWLMNFLYSIIPNFGIVIIILTIIIKIVLWPLGNKGYKSMNEMKKLQPLMAEIREKHKENKQKMNEEIMSLYKTYKINPLGGCLPMVAQIPIFIAFYRMLFGAIELRHAPFFLWINDLSAPDRLFNFDITIPFMEPPFGIPVLTIVMGATMFLQQKMQPPPGDPAQAKMMMLMPLFFTFIFINFSSGLVLYWLVNNVLGIMQQYYISKKFS
ncbi:MAG: membrane protein insertase YidC [Desulfobacteraceae bacterium]|jgi:YidC/Oxa1 family membrane protein insertase|nr:membrane protein insertase YidC [Desulfobacteraceae bacterium]